jgi:hypothetical protein
MSKFSDFVSGGSGAKIDEIRFFIDKGNLFTDADGQVWLKAGARTLDTTTYPDAHTENIAFSATADFQATGGIGSGSPRGLGISSDGAWALATNTSSGNAWGHTNITSNVSVNNIAFPGVSGFELLSMGYIKCNGSVPSSISNANNYFSMAIGYYPGGQLRGWCHSLVGGSGTDAGRLNGSQDNFFLRDTSGNDLHTGNYVYARSSTKASHHWDPVNRQLYVLFSYSTKGSGMSHLFRYSKSGDSFGHSGYSVGSNNYNANAVVDLYASNVPVRQMHQMSGSSTHLYIAYQEEAPSYALKIRKIPLSGNLSWASGTTLDGEVKDSATGENLLRANSGGTFSSYHGSYDSPTYMRTVNSKEKFMGIFEGINTSYRTLTEFSIDNAAIGQASWDYRRAQTAYQRIK